MSANLMVSAVTRGVPAGDFKPRNCHESVLGWGFASVGDIAPWQRVRTISNNIQRVKGMVQSLPATAMAGLYMSGPTRRLGLHGPLTAQMGRIIDVDPGDVIFFGGPSYPTHSMVATAKGTNQLLGLGFNQMALGGPVGAFDPIPRDLAEAGKWTTANEYETGHLGHQPMWAMDYVNFCRALNTFLASHT